MNDNQKTFKLKNEDSIFQLIQNILILILIYICVHFVITKSFLEGNNIVIDTKSSYYYSIIMALPYQLTYFFYRYKTKYSNKRLKKVSVKGIEYYREKLDNINPAMMSLAANLKIEEKKDIKAMIMYYEKNGIIEEKNERIIVKNDKHPLLTESDKHLLEYLKEHDLLRNVGDYIKWENELKKEGIDKGYFVMRDIKYIFIQLIKVLGYIIIICLANYICKDICRNFYFDTQTFTITSLKDFTNLFPTIFSYSLVIASRFLIVACIIYAFSIIINNLHAINEVARTQKGNELAEKIYGLKRYINEFSVLEERSKEELALWDDFLIYAVVLGENTRILDEIKSYKTVY